MEPQVKIQAFGNLRVQIDVVRQLAADDLCHQIMQIADAAQPAGKRLGRIERADLSNDAVFEHPGDIERILELRPDNRQWSSEKVRVAARRANPIRQRA